MEGRYVEAEKLLKGALDSRRQILGSDHRDTVIASGWLGDLRLRQSRYGEAERILGDAFAFFVRTQPDSWQRYHHEAMFGASLAGGGQLATGRGRLTAGYHGMSRSKGISVEQEKLGLAEAKEWLERFPQPPRQ